jgi:hypothetical protein
LSGIGLLLAAGAGVLLRQTGAQANGEASPAVARTGVSGNSGSGLLLTLKEELFALETERLDGRLSQAEYEQVKAALEIVLKRALDRNASKKVI